MTLINNWTNTTSTLVLTQNSTLAHTSGNNFILTTGTAGDPPYYSQDGGNIWTAATLSDSTWTASATAPSYTAYSSDGTLYLINQNVAKLYKSTDKGITYSIASAGTSYSCLACVGSTLFATASAGAALYKSTDNGLSFTIITMPDSSATGLSVYAKDGYLFLLGAHQNTTYLSTLYRSSDYGVTWTPVLTDRALGYIGAIFHTATSIYFGIYDPTASALEILKSDDYFSTSTIVPMPSVLQAPVTLGGANSSNNIYIASSYAVNALCTSSDGGITFTNEPPDSVMPATLAVGDTSIVEISYSASGVNLYCGLLPGGHAKPNQPTFSPTTTTNTVAKLNNISMNTTGLIVSDDTHLYVPYAPTLYIINPHTGEYTQVTITQDSYVSAAYYNNKIYLSSANIYALDLSTYVTTLISSQPFSKPVSGLTVYNNKLYCCSPLSHISTMNLDGTNETIINSSSNYYWDSLTAYQGFLYAGTLSYTDTNLNARPGGIYKLNPSTGEVLDTIITTTDSYWTGLTISENQLYARDSLRGIYRVNITDHSVTQIVSIY